jgi:hypothetical protein
MPLSEADTLRDIFANLSPPEHDDPRNFYTTRSIAQFNTWYGQILAIKAAVTDVQLTGIASVHQRA